MINHRSAHDEKVQDHGQWHLTPLPNLQSATMHYDVKLLIKLLRGATLT